MIAAAFAIALRCTAGPPWSSPCARVRRYRAGMAMTGLVLAGGRSTRMGRDKALLEWDGVALVDRTTATLRKVCDEVLIASGDGARLGRPGEIADALPDAGPLGGLLAALEAAEYPLVAVVAVDMPHASAAVLKALAAALGDADAAVPVVDGRAHPLHAVYATRALPGLRDYVERGGRSVMGFLDVIDARQCGAEDWSAADPVGRFATNLNTPGDAL